MEYITAIIGVAGTLLGTILGFLLNIWANKGKIKFVLLNDWSQGFFSDVYIDVEILNTNHYPVILRDFYIIFDKKLKKLYASQEETTCVSYGEGNPFKTASIKDFIKYDVSLVRCDEKSRRMVRLSIKHTECEEEDFEKLMTAKHIKIYYTNNQGKRKKYRILIDRNKK